MHIGFRKRLGDARRGWKARSLTTPVLSAIWACGLALAGGWAVWEMRASAWHEARTVSENILDVAGRSIERDIELYDLSLQAVQQRVGRPDVMALPASLRRMTIFDNSSSARGLGRIHYTDAKGNIVDTSSGDPGNVNVADRDYFVAQRDNPNLGTFVSKPITGRIGKERYLVLSRRLVDAGGAFAGVVVGQIKLSYLRELFHTVRQGEGGQIGLYRADGVVMVREPMSPGDRQSDDVSIAGTPTQARFDAETSGTFMTPDAEREPERMHVFQRVSGTTLVLDVAVATDTVLACWRKRATWVAAALAGLFASFAFLVWRNQRELLLRRAAETAALSAKREAVRMSETDSLTGLANRRVFDRAMADETVAMDSDELPLTVVVLDADLFKRLNDSLGHAAGDDALKGIAGVLANLTKRSGEVACRIGGEEFAVILPNHREADGMRWAGRAGEAVRAACLGDPDRPLTVSLGVAQARTGESVEALMERADAALYEAKRSGRNRAVASSAAATGPVTSAKAA